MKYMNNRFDQSRIFNHARCKMPMNIQFFAEPAGGDDGGGSEGIEGKEGAEPGGTPTVDELMAQLAQERATNAQNKAALDKALKEKAN